MDAWVLTAAENEQATAAMRGVFDSLDPFNEPFCKRMARRAILYPAEGYELSDEQWLALAGAAAHFGESSAYYANVEGRQLEQVRPVWAVPLSSEGLAWFEASATDGTREPIVESALWSPNATWGLLISHEEHIVIGGGEGFIGRLIAQVPDADEQARNFVRHVSAYSNRGFPPWLPNLLAHVYGASKAHHLLEATRE